MVSRLGDEKGYPAAGKFENRRNGVSEKTVRSEDGNVHMYVPRDRQGTPSRRDWCPRASAADVKGHPDSTPVCF